MMFRKPAVFHKSARLAVAAAAGLALAAVGTGGVSGAAASEPGTAVPAAARAEPISRPVPAPGDVPAALQVPDGDYRHVVLPARGVQVYTCVSGAWSLLEPAATLFDGSRAVALHTRGPEWVSTVDGSAVTGTVLASVPQKTAIAELLLKATANRGMGIFGKVAYIQRLDTKGGLAPAGTCSSGRQIAVPYTATYVFSTPVS
jgi:hypothetical protein